jgi:hypothetical protein
MDFAICRINNLATYQYLQIVDSSSKNSYLRQAPRRDFSPRVWKGGALAPPLQALPDYSRLPRSPQRPAASCAGRTEGGSRDFSGAEASPFRQSPKSVPAW